ncbi:hypothetical protein [Streptomyces sp. NPDC006510]|uniref:hypothetical protein n=1 Tax=Streptomyces sp. NPDC006510 TaxID=3155600 RepID=UPI0033A02652
MATEATKTYRHTKRADTGLSQVCAFMDRAINEQFGNDHFVTAQMICSVKSNSSSGLTEPSVTTRRCGRPVVRALSHALEQERGGVTSDDAAIFLIEWRGDDADHLATLD